MGEYLRLLGAVLIGLILPLVLGKQARDMSTLQSQAVCVLVGIGVMEFWKPVMEFLQDLRRLGELDNSAVSILLKCAGIGIVSELAGLICADAGQSDLAKILQLCSNAAVLWLSLPLFQQIVEMIGEDLAKF